VSRQTISTITDKVIEGMVGWQNRPLDPVYPVMFIDAIHVKIRDGQVANRPIYVALAVTAEGHRYILGLWAGDGGEGAKYWLHVLTELRNRGVVGVLMAVCDGLAGLPEAVTTVWPRSIVQTCIVHLLRNSFRYAGRQHWAAIAAALKPVYTAATEPAAQERFAEFVEAWGTRYPAIVRLWQAALGRVRAVPELRHRDPANHLHHQRHRIGQRPHPPRRQGPRALPQRAGRVEVCLPGGHGDPQCPPVHRRFDSPGPDSGRTARRQWSAGVLRRSARLVTTRSRMLKKKRLAAIGIGLVGVVAAMSLTLAAPASAAPVTPKSGCLSSCGCDVNVKIRSGPGTGYTAVGLCAQGDFVTRHWVEEGDVPPGCTGPTNVDWDYVTDQRTGVTGYVSDCYISQWT
jgi:uncharacterized protein YraI